MTEHDQSFAEFFDLVDEAHRTAVGGDDLSPNVWAQVRSQIIATNSQENPQMSTLTLQSGPVSTPSRTAMSSSPFLSRFANVAAAVVLVSALVLSSWYAVTNLGPTGGDNNGIAFAPTGEMTKSDVCTVEPLTVDRVMEIVKNPIPFMTNGAAGDPMEPANSSWPGAGELFEPSMLVQMPLFYGDVLHPDEEQFGDIGSIADAYLKCLVFGTQGQAWTFYSPVHIQQEVLDQFPVFATEAEVRAYVEANITQPAYLSDIWWNDTVSRFEPSAVSINPDFQLSISRMAQPQAFAEVMSFGVRFVDGDGAPIYLTNGMGTLIGSTQTSASYGLKINVGQSAIGGAWFVVPSWW